MPRLTKYSATERQEGMRELEDQLPEQFFTWSREWWELNHPYPHEHWDDWRSWRPFTENTIGGKFLQTLTRFEIVQDFKYSNSKKRNQETWWLYELVSVAPSGYIYISDSGKNIHAVKRDIARTPTLGDLIKGVMRDC